MCSVDDRAYALLKMFGPKSEMGKFQTEISLNLAYSLCYSDFDIYFDSVEVDSTHRVVSLRFIREVNGLRTVVYMWCHIPCVRGKSFFIRYSHCGTYRSNEKEHTQMQLIAHYDSLRLYREVFQIFNKIDMADRSDLAEYTRSNPVSFASDHAVPVIPRSPTLPIDCSVSDEEWTKILVEVFGDGAAAVQFPR